MQQLKNAAAMLALLAGIAGFSTPLWAETGQVVVLFTKGGYIVGVAGGVGELTVGGKRYPFTATGTDVGFSIGPRQRDLWGGLSI